jgi:DNA transformation protein and related proteins
MPDDDFLQLVLQQLVGLGVLRTRKMFGGQYIYCDELFVATVHDGKLYFKANARTEPDCLAIKRPLFSYLKKGGVATLQYYQAPPDVFDHSEAMLRWGRLALLAAQQDAEKVTKQLPRARSNR